MTAADARTRTPVVRRTHRHARLGLLAPIFSRLGFRRRRFRYGMELVVDVTVPDLAVIADPVRLQEFVDQLVRVIDMKAYPISDQERTWIRHFGHAEEHAAVTAGYTVIQPIETSSIVVHLSEGQRTAHINVFSCRWFDPRRALEFIEEFFRALETTHTVLVR